jgi:ribosomal-protein-alanine N-acetyltransferase
MPTPDHWKIRAALEQDHPIVTALLAGAGRRHQHLDWLRPYHLLSLDPFLIATDRGVPIGLLACPPGPREVSWVRLFASASAYDPARVWSVLWDRAQQKLNANPQVRVVAALALGPWLKPLLERSGFEETNAVVFYRWEAQALPDPPRTASTLRVMTSQDMTTVAELDQISFDLIWRNAESTLREAYRQSTIATLMEADGQAVGYQISTCSALGAHLARLAVHPDWRRRGIGTALVIDLLGRFRELGFDHVTVNTQKDNVPSLRLYQKLGFQRTLDEFPVYDLRLKKPQADPG